jgi:hypothetical protein
MISTTLTVVGENKTTTKVPSSGALAVEHSIPLPKQHPLVYKGAWDPQANGGLSLTQSLIFKRVNLKACICCLRVKSPISLRSPHRPFTKGGGH